jgi:hypothetical protein
MRVKLKRTKTLTKGKKKIKRIRTKMKRKKTIHYQLKASIHDKNNRYLKHQYMIKINKLVVFFNV